MKKILLLVLLLFGCSSHYLQEAETHIDNEEYQLAYDILVEHEAEVEPDVLFTLAVWQLNGVVTTDLDVTSKNEKAISWLQKSASKHHKKSLKLLIEIYRYGEVEGVAKSESTSGCYEAVLANPQKTINECSGH